MIQLIARANSWADRTAIISEDRIYSYKDLLDSSARIATYILQGSYDIEEARVAFIVAPGFDYVAIQWAIWRAGGIAVPLCVKHPLASIRYVLEDTQASIIMFSPEFEELLLPLFGELKAQFICTSDYQSHIRALPDVDMSRRAMILYTSGTTGNPKGVVSTHMNIETQIKSLTTSWQWSQHDHILNILPLHHVHGIINILSCALWSGACCEFIGQFSPESVFETFLRKKVNVFMAVPTIYYKLIAHYKELSKSEQKEISEVLSAFRLMVSGSAALPISVLEDWKGISGHILLERYGMTEMGMAISNPYEGTRRPGHIGQALDGVTVRIVDENNQPVEPGTPGEIQVKGPNVFREYWQKPEASANAFTSDGWFMTGDIAELNGDSYRILGRNSVDIIKSGGYKISALEIEEVLRTHEYINECAVVGIPDDEWGEIIGASLVVGDYPVDFDDIMAWLKDKLPSYKIPRKYITQDDLPRNVMGKVIKNELKNMFVS